MIEIYLALIIGINVFAWLKLGSVLEISDSDSPEFDSIQNTAVSALRVLCYLMVIATLVMSYLIFPQVATFSVSQEINASNYNATALSNVSQMVQFYENANWGVFLTFIFVQLILFIALLLIKYTNIGVALLKGRGRGRFD